MISWGWVRKQKGICEYKYAKEEFTSIDAHWPGSVHDGGILRGSELFGVMENQRTDSILLGDVGCGIHSWLLTPFKPPRNPQEVAYSKLLSKERDIIERYFGQMTQRFSILQLQSQSQTRQNPKKCDSLLCGHAQCCEISARYSSSRNWPIWRWQYRRCSRWYLT